MVPQDQLEQLAATMVFVCKFYAAAPAVPSEGPVPVHGARLLGNVVLGVQIDEVFGSYTPTS